MICAACEGCPVCQGSGQVRPGQIGYVKLPIFPTHARSTLPPPLIYAPEPFSRAEIKALVAKMEAAQREALVAVDERIKALEAAKDRRERP